MEPRPNMCYKLIT